MIRRALPAIIIALIALAIFPFQGQSAEKLKFATPLKVSPYLGLPPLAAQEQGFWKEEGLDAEWVAFDSGGAMARALAGGHVDMAIHGTSSVIMEIARGVPQIIVAEMEAKYDFMVFVPSKSALRQPKDIKGTKIGVIGFGSLAEIFGRVVTRNLGLEKDVKFVALGSTPSMVAGLKAGAVDGMLTTFFGVAPLVFAGEIREVLVVTDHLPKNWSEIILNVRNDFLQKQPESVKKGVRAILKAGQFLLQNKSWTIEKTKSQFRYTPEAAAGIFPVLHYSKEGKIDRQALENVTNLLLEYGLIVKEKTPPVEQMYTRQITG